jgi:hypothetical protein
MIRRPSYSLLILSFPYSLQTQFASLTLFRDDGASERHLDFEIWPRKLAQHEPVSQKRHNTVKAMLTLIPRKKSWAVRWSSR